MKHTTRKAPAIFGATAILGALLCCPSCSSEAPQPQAPNVILICLDTVRADHFGCYGYDERDTTPFMDALAQRSLRFADTTATASWTKPSVPSIFTGLLPMQHGVYRGSARDEAGTFSDVLPEEAVTLAEAFRERGYQTGAFVKNSQLRTGLGFEQGFDVYQDRAGDAREIRWQATDWLDAREADRPFYLYLHYLDAHWPYPVPDEYAGRYAEMEIVDRIRSGDWRALRKAVNHGEEQMSAEDLETLIALYDSAIRYMDDQLALLWAKLEREGLAENTIICIVADHGEEFLEHGRLGHGHGLYENLLSVPWILHVPGVPGAAIETRVSLLDLYPTLLAAADIDVNVDELPGVNRLHKPDERRPLIAEHLEPKRYLISWSQADEKSVETLTPERLAAQADPLLSELDTRGRWEARLVFSDAGAREIRRLRPAKDQEEDEVELKGLVEGLTKSDFTIAGIQVEVAESSELYGALEDERGWPRALTSGMQVKVRGSVRNGKLIARKIKLYPAGDELVLELRGALTITADEQVEVGGFAVSFTKKSELDFGGGPPDLGPAEVAMLLTEELELESRELVHYELELDPEEHTPLAGGPAILQDRARLERLRSFLSTRIWGSGAKRRLGSEELSDLRAIGYAE